MIEIVIDKSSGHLADGRNEFKRADRTPTQTTLSRSDTNVSQGESPS